VGNGKAENDANSSLATEQIETEKEEPKFKFD